jgi:serine/threonine protein kinase
MLQICEALAAAHALGIVHRDLKPSNLFLTRKSDGTPLIKVLDFGISKALDDPNIAPVDSLTMSHRLLGSPHYMSPEQARAPKSADARSDIWSLGVVLYELILGERPFRGETAVAILASLLSDVVPELNAEQRRKMPDELMAVILRCLKRDPSQRFANVAELARALLPMASPHSEVVVARIESITRTSPAPDSPPAASPSPDTLKHTHGSTLVSGRSSLAGATSTRLLDSQGLPILQRKFGAKALVLLAVIGALFYWFVVRSIPAPHDLGAAASAQSDRLQKPYQPARAKATQEPPDHAPRASVEVGPVAPPFEPTTSVSAVPSAPVHSGRKGNARTQPGASAPAASSNAPSSAGKSKGLPGLPKPSSTADPKNQPE